MSGIFEGKKLPAVAITSLVFGGACANESLAEKACEAMERCEPEEFAYEFSSMSECVSEMNEELDYIRDEMSRYAGARCADAYLDMTECRIDDMSDCEYDYGSCDQFYSRIYDACDFYDY